MAIEADLSVGAPGAPEVEPDAGDVAGDVDVGLVEPDVVELAPITEATTRAALLSAGGIVGAFVGDDDVDRHWRFEADELDELVPPLTRIANRTPRLARVLRHGDELAVATALGMYVERNTRAAIAARKARNERDREVERAPTAPDGSDERAPGEPGPGWTPDGGGDHPAGGGSG